MLTSYSCCLAACSEQDPFLKRDDGDEESQHLTREEILEKIREKKECIEKLRCQPWSMHRKLRTLRFDRNVVEKTSLILT